MEDVVPRALLPRLGVLMLKAPDPVASAADVERSIVLVDYVVGQIPRPRPKNEGGALDTLALWGLTLLNTFTIVLILRQLALRRQDAVRHDGPPVGSTLSGWTLNDLDGISGGSGHLPPSHVLVFAANNCAPCHDLFRDLATHPVETSGLAYLVIDQDTTTIRQALSGVPAATFARVFVGSTPELLLSLRVPSTPFGVAIRNGHVASARAVHRGAVLTDLVKSVAPNA